MRSKKVDIIVKSIPVAKTRTVVRGLDGSATQFARKLRRLGLVDVTAVLERRYCTTKAEPVAKTWIVVPWRSRQLSSAV